MLAAKHKGRENTSIFKVSKGAACYVGSKPKMGERNIYTRNGDRLGRLLETNQHEECACVWWAFRMK